MKGKKKDFFFSSCADIVIVTRFNTKGNENNKKLSKNCT